MVINQQVTSLTAEVRRVSQLIDETKGRSEEEGRESQRTVSQLEVSDAACQSVVWVCRAHVQ